MSKKDTNFKVFSLTAWNSNDQRWKHWADDLKLIIKKDGVSIVLDGCEAQQLVKALPRTFGGKY